MIAMAARECFAGAYGPSYLEISARRAGPRGLLSTRRCFRSPATIALRRVRSAIRADIEKLADVLVKAERPAILFGQQVWAARGHKEAIALLRASTFPAISTVQAAACCPPGDPHHFDRTRSLAFGKADVVVIVGTPFDFRMGYGKRINVPTLVQIDQDYRTVGKNRDITFGLVGDPGAILGAVLAAATGEDRPGQASAAPAVDEELHDAEAAATEKLMPVFKSRPDADPSVPRRLRDQRVPGRGHDLYRRRRRRRHDLGAGCASA